MSTIEGGANLVKVNRLKDGWTWNVSVAAADSTIEELAKAKEAALRISYELRDELLPSTTASDEDAEGDEIPF